MYVHIRNPNSNVKCNLSDHNAHREDPSHHVYPIHRVRAHAGDAGTCHVWMRDGIDTHHILSCLDVMGVMRHACHASPDNPVTPRADDTHYDDDDDKHTPRHTPSTPYQHTPTPHTPGARYHTPHTPHTPAPQTPGAGAGEEEDDVDADATPATPSSNTLTGEPLPPGAMVSCRDAAAAQRDDWEDAWSGVVQTHTAQHYSVRPDGQTRSKKVAHANVKTIVPEKGQTVIVLTGPNQGQSGVLIGKHRDDMHHHVMHVDAVMLSCASACHCAVRHAHIVHVSSSGIDGTEGLVRANDILMVQMSSLSRYLKPAK